ncbi:MAG: lytic murein transglycosylase B [Gammaproteobacteria bacterium]|nr:lytic murein transglycosylase B [Gammaproteobacteria bacterium]
MNTIKSFFLLISLLGFIHTASSDTLSSRTDVKQFIDEMVNEHEFDEANLKNIFDQAKIRESIIKAISRPAEAKPWYKYRPIFLTADRIKLGVKFLQENEETLRRAEQKYGVPVEIIVAIIGVETRYGKHAGKYKVINSLSTLAFEYPKRSRFFRSELKHFLLLCREQGLDPMQVKGSYAGAMGIPQFISSSYRSYAADFDSDNKIDIWDNPVDAIGSVGNYFKVHGWKAGEMVATRAEVENDKYLAVLSKGLELHMNSSELAQYGISGKQMPEQDMKIKFLEYEQKKEPEFWLGFHNFYVITRYNHSALYAMAVYQLSTEILKKYNAQKSS